jgi:hypothetical protein
VRDPIWQTSNFAGPSDLLGLMSAEVSRFNTRFPDTAGATEALASAISAELKNQTGS